MSRAVLSVGSNQGNSAEILQRAVAAIDLLPQTRVLQASRVYRTAPWGYLDQPDFLNAALLVETELSPCALLGACLGIEAAFKRVRTFPNAPRTLDIDLIIMQGVHMNTEELTLPHPRFRERAFVLAPLKDLFPNGVALGEPFGDALESVKNQRVTPIEMPTICKHPEGL